MQKVEVFPHKRGLVRTGAERIVRMAEDAIRARDRCLVALAGGSTPRPLYELLAAPQFAPRIDWSLFAVRHAPGCRSCCNPCAPGAATDGLCHPPRGDTSCMPSPGPQVPGSYSATRAGALRIGSTMRQASST